MEDVAPSRALKLPSQARSKEKVRRILQAAREIIAKEGVAALTTNRIADLSGVTVGSIYQYFRNKEAIAYDVFSLWLGEAYDDYLLYSQNKSNESSSLIYFTEIFSALHYETEDEGEMFAQLDVAAVNNDDLRALKEAHIARMCKKTMQDVQRLNPSFIVPGAERSIRFHLLVLYEMERIISQSSKDDRIHYIELGREMIRRLPWITSRSDSEQIMKPKQ